MPAQTASVFGGEVGRLEDELVAAKRALANAERQSNERAEQLRDVKRDLGAAEATVESLMKDLEDTRRDLDSARALAGRVSAAETKASDEAKRADKIATEARQQTVGRAVAEGKLVDALARLDEANGELKRLAAEVEPARAVAAALVAREDARIALLAAAKKIRPQA